MIIPAVDLINGRVARLFQGNYKQEIIYSDDPLGKCTFYQDQGIQYLHLIDLDGAKDSSLRQLDLVESLIKSINIPIQVGGGIRSEKDVSDLLGVGAQRVIIGTLAVKQPKIVSEWLTTYGSERFVLALDININASGVKQVAVNGWQQNSGITIEQLIAIYQPKGLGHVLCTDISRDGTLQGSNIALYQELCCDYPQISWQSSGGVSSLDDIHTLRVNGITEIIIGRALLEEKFTLEEAITCWRNASSPV